ncbi:MAG: hypothetical protein U5R48_08190 [Gammaproteobacteria bacterium]|nr:hypothetical protein [Gammaproteobacteria bacterium]
MEFVRSRALRTGIGLLLVLLVTGCVSQTVKTVNSEPLRNLQSIPESELLDVGIHIFDPAIPEDWEEREERSIIPDVRRAEARYMPQVLKSTLVESGNWGAVRVIPRETRAVDLVVEARILHSDGEKLALDVEVEDATGRVWIDREYEHLTSRYAYEQDGPRGIDPFRPLYVEIANDILEVRGELAAEERKRIRQVAEMRFAREFAPEAFEGYVEQKRNGRWELQRLPAESDPMLARIRKVREREYLFIDTLDEYYREFRREMRSSSSGLPPVQLPGSGQSARIAQGVPQPGHHGHPGRARRDRRGGERRRLYPQRRQCRHRRRRLCAEECLRQAGRVADPRGGAPRAGHVAGARGDPGGDRAGRPDHHPHRDRGRAVRCLAGDPPRALPDRDRSRRRAGGGRRTGIERLNRTATRSTASGPIHRPTPRARQEAPVGIQLP